MAFFNLNIDDMLFMFSGNDRITEFHVFIVSCNSVFTLRYDKIIRNSSYVYSYIMGELIIFAESHSFFYLKMNAKI